MRRKQATVILRRSSKAKRGAAVEAGKTSAKQRETGRTVGPLPQNELHEGRDATEEEESSLASEEDILVIHENAKNTAIGGMVGGGRSGGEMMAPKIAAESRQSRPTAVTFASHAQTFKAKGTRRRRDANDEDQEENDDNIKDEIERQIPSVIVKGRKSVSGKRGIDPMDAGSTEKTPDSTIRQVGPSNLSPPITKPQPQKQEQNLPSPPKNALVDELRDKFERLTMLRTTEAEHMLEQYKRAAETRLAAAEQLITALRKENEQLQSISRASSTAPRQAPLSDPPTTCGDDDASLQILVELYQNLCGLQITPDADQGLTFDLSLDVDEGQYCFRPTFSPSTPLAARLPAYLQEEIAFGCDQLQLFFWRALNFLMSSPLSRP